TTGVAVGAAVALGTGYELLRPPPVPVPSPKPRTDDAKPTVPSKGAIAAIAGLAADSEIARFSWKDRGRAPTGDMKGMALVFARVYLKLKAGDAAAVDIARANTGEADHDILAYYDDIFAEAGMTNTLSGPSTLRHVFALLVGLGMRESAGKYCLG